MAHPDNLQLLQQAEAAYQQGKHSEAARMVNQALENDPDDYQAWWALANITEYESQKRAALKRVLELNPQHADAREILAQYEGVPYAGKKKGDGGDFWRNLHETFRITPDEFFGTALFAFIFYGVFYPIGLFINLASLWRVRRYRVRFPEMPEPSGAGCHRMLLVMLVILPTLGVLVIALLTLWKMSMLPAG